MQDMWMCIWLDGKWKMFFCSMDMIRLLFTAHWFSISLAKDTNTAAYPAHQTAGGNTIYTHLCFTLK